jgi:hypothetical protein
MNKHLYNIYYFKIFCKKRKGLIAQFGQSGGLLIRRSRVRIPLSPFIYLIVKVKGFETLIWKKLKLPQIRRICEHPFEPVYLFNSKG